MPTHRKSGYPPPTSAAAPARVYFSGSRICRRRPSVPGAARDALLLRVIGSPDPYGKHTDGMGGATSSTSKTVILSKSGQPDHDVDYLFGQVAIDKSLRRLER